MLTPKQMSKVIENCGTDDWATRWIVVTALCALNDAIKKDRAAVKKEYGAVLFDYIEGYPEE